MAAVSLAALQRKQPLLPSPPNYYPTRNKFEFTLTKLIKSLEGRLVGRYRSPQEKTPPYHNTQEILQSDLFDTESLIKSYLKVKPADPVLVGQTIFPVLSGPVGQRKPSIRTIAIGIFFRDPIVTGLIERAEKALAPEVFAVDDWRYFLPKFEEHMAWVKVIRLCIVIAIVKAIDYKDMWGQKDGDTGWWLSEKVRDLAASILDLDEYKALWINFLREGTFLEGLGLKTSIEAQLRSVQNVISEVNKWQNGCKLNSSCAVSDLGTKHPWSFKKINPDLFKASGLAAEPFPVHMHARKKAIERAEKMKFFWDKLIEAGVISKEFQFTISAGSLLHGGAHPPHTDHRDGSMFDMDIVWSVRKFPDMVPIEGPPRLVPEKFLPEVKEEPVEHVEDEPIEEHQVIPEEQQKLYVLKRTADWDFPPHDEIYGELNKMARKFTQCIYLTFPSSVIYASEKITVEAKWNLIDRINSMIDDPKYSPEKTILIAIKALIYKTDPAPWKWKPKEKEGKIRKQHRNHWHVNYNPDRLGDEGAIRSLKQDLATEIATTLQTLIKGELWKKLIRPGPWYGSDGVIPIKYHPKVDHAIDLAWRLNNDVRFAKVFQETVFKLNGKGLQRDIYANTLDKMVINLAETTNDLRIQQELKKDIEAVKKDPNYKPPAAYSIINGTDVWLREFLLESDSKVIAGALIHEAAHLSGAPTNPMAEIALERINDVAGYPRYQ